MIDKSIPYFNIIMRYDGPLIKKCPTIPNGFSLSPFIPGDEHGWAQMEVDNNDFDTYENAVSYFSSKYLSEPIKLQERFIGVRDNFGKLVGCVICWDDFKDKRYVASVHWLVTDPKVQGNGIGTFLMKTLLYRFSKMNMIPIYLHTQPWSFFAIGIYSRLGFRMLKEDTFRDYSNQCEQALPILKELMEKNKYDKLVSEII